MGLVGKDRFRFYLFNNRNGEFIEVRDGSLCGRVEGDLLFGKDTSMSRRQCGFVVTGNDIYIEDFGSTNPTKVNSVPMQSGKRRRIQLNDVIEVGTQRLILTNQCEHAPGSVQDLPTQSGALKAYRRDDGSLTTSLPTPDEPRTQVLLNEAQFRKLRAGKTLERLARMWKLFIAIAIVVGGGAVAVRLFSQQN